MTVKSDTQTIRLEVEPSTAFAFLADPNNLPLWAIGFCRGIRQEGPTWIVETAGGECRLDIDADSRRGTIDFQMRPAPDVEASAFSRLVPCAGGCEYVFTQLAPAGASDEMFRANVEALKEELFVLRSILRARRACPA